MRRPCPALLLLLASALPAAAQEGKRYGVPRDARNYHQATAKEALASALKAIDAGNFAYLVAQLAEPAFVDDRVKRVYGGKFDEQVSDTRARLDPATVLTGPRRSHRQHRSQDPAPPNRHPELVADHPSPSPNLGFARPAARSA